MLPDTKGPRPDEASLGVRIRNWSLRYKRLERPAHRANRTHQDAPGRKVIFLLMSYMYYIPQPLLYYYDSLFCLIL